MIETLIGIIITLVIVGVIWWGVNQILPMIPVPPVIAKIIQVVMTVILVIICIWVLIQLLGVAGVNVGRVWPGSIR